MSNMIKLYCGLVKNGLIIMTIVNNKTVVVENIFTEP